MKLFWWLGWLGAIMVCLTSFLGGPHSAWAEEVVNCDQCHLGEEISGPGLLSLAPAALSELTYQPCPGLKQLFLEKYLLESRLTNLSLVSTRYGRAKGGAGTPASCLEDVAEDYRELLFVSPSDARTLAAAVPALRLRLDGEVYRPLVRGWRRRQLYLWGGMLWLAMLVLLALVWVRYLPWRRRWRDMELKLNQERRGPELLSGSSGSNDRSTSRNRL